MPAATHEARTPRIGRRHCHDTVPSLAGLLFGGTVRRAAKQARKGLTQMQADARGCTLMSRSPAWSFTATIARPFLMSLAAAPVRVPSACISGHPPASALNPFLLALPRAAPRRKGPRAPRVSQNPYTFESHAAGITCVVRVELPGAAKGPCASSALHGSAPRQNGRDDSPVRGRATERQYRDDQHRARPAVQQESQ
jgi:hypothetical protein